MSTVARQYEEWNPFMPDSKNVLVVEDDPFWQKVIRQNIDKASDRCEVTFVTTADEALYLLNQENNFRLIVADQFLDGERTGYDLWQACQARGIQVPFLLTSGKADFADEFADSTPHFIAKPFVASEVRKTLASLLSEDLAPNYFAFTPIADIESNGLNMTFLLAVGALLALAVYTAALPLIRDRTLIHPQEILTPPPTLPLFRSPFERMAEPRPAATRQQAAEKKFDSKWPTLESRIEIDIRQAEEKRLQQGIHLHLLKNLPSGEAGDDKSM